MRRSVISTIVLAAALLLAACGGTAGLNVDNTEPVSPANRVIYEMNAGAFTPEGTFKAAEARLSELKKLGIDIVWLMPIYPRGKSMNSPYASMDFKAVNPSYGRVADLKSFVARAHELGMEVWLDWVPNHVAVENPWVESHPEYFTKDADGSMIHPHGWNDVLELNYQDNGLVEEMNSAMKFWIDEADIDGFRCDYVTSPTIPVSYWQDIISTLKSYKPGKSITFMSETDISSPDNARIDSCGFDYDYAWWFQDDALKKGFGAEGTQADTLRALCEKLLDASGKIKNRRMVYLTNHDQNYNDGGNTLKRMYGDNRYALTVLEFTLYGMPLLYNGQEIGDNDTLNYFTDSKIDWGKKDAKMLNTVRTLIALKHTQKALADDAEVKFLAADSPEVLAYMRGEVLVVLNFGNEEASVKVSGTASGAYTRWLDSRTIAEGPSASDVTLDESIPITLDGKGYAVYVRE